MGNRTTIREFKCEERYFWGTILLWATKSNFELKEDLNYKKIYRKNILLMQCWLIAEHDGTQAKLEAWVGGRQHSFLNPQSPLESMYSLGVKVAYKEVLNKLLNDYGQSNI